MKRRRHRLFPLLLLSAFESRSPLFSRREREKWYLHIIVGKALEKEKGGGRRRVMGLSLRRRGHPPTQGNGEGSKNRATRRRRRKKQEVVVPSWALLLSCTWPASKSMSVEKRGKKKRKKGAGGIDFGGGPGIIAFERTGVGVKNGQSAIEKCGGLGP